MSLSSTDYNTESFILIVDDDNTLLKFFKIHLNKFFSKVIVVDSAKEAVKKLKEKNIDLVISDIRMPKTDGIELIGKVRKFDPSIPTLLVSGALLSDEQIEKITSEADGFLRKPFSVDQLHSFIENGMKLREAYSELAPMARSKKCLRDLIKNEMSVEEAIKKASQTRANEILNEINSEIKKAS